MLRVSGYFSGRGCMTLHFVMVYLLPALANVPSGFVNINNLLRDPWKQKKNISVYMQNSQQVRTNKKTGATHNYSL